MFPALLIIKMIQSTDKFYINSSSESSVIKLTGLWAFSEAFLGGILHAVSIPFSGALLNGFAVILISMIAFFSQKKWEVLKATFVVMLVKLAVSPHTPATAYLAVSFQGVLGEFLFFSKKFYKLSCVALGMLTLLFTALQRLIILTIIFGNTFWNSIDIYSSLVIKQFFNSPNNELIRISYYIIGVYILLHLIIGFWAGSWAARMPLWISEVNKTDTFREIDLNNKEIELPLLQKNKKRWWEKKSWKIILSIIFVLVIISYFEPSIGKNRAADLLLMLLRSTIVLFLWFTLISPLLIKYLNKLFKKKGTASTQRVNEILGSFPQIKNITIQSWRFSSKEKGIKRIKQFLISSIFLIIFK